jgi:carbon-monoxide dehydrogenase medium subunit
MTAGDATAAGELDYHAPDSLEDACRRLEAAEDPTVIAGGQTLMLLVRQGFVEADALVDVTGVPAMSGVAVEDGAVTVGATTPYAALADHPASERARLLADACGVIADPQVRAMGTVGGALCHADPSFDLLAPLLCLDSEMRLVDADGARELPLREFLVGHMRTALEDGELLASVRFALPGADWGTAYEKHAPVDGGWATVGAAAAVHLADGAVADARVGLTAVGDTALRSPAAEDELRGEPAEAAALAAASEAAVDDVDPIDDRSGSAAYKRRLATTLVERALATAVERAGGAR